jgi:hypothetical protein
MLKRSRCPGTSTLDQAKWDEQTGVMQHRSHARPHAASALPERSLPTILHRRYDFVHLDVLGRTIVSCQQSMPHDTEGRYCTSGYTPQPLCGRTAMGHSKRCSNLFYHGPVRTLADQAYPAS